MERLNITLADENPMLLEQLADMIIHESYNRGIDYILVNPQEIGMYAGKVDKIHYVMDHSKEKTVKTQKNTIIDELNKIGMPASLKGYRYMITAIQEVLKDETVLEGITKVLYPEIAKQHESTPQRVEKAIRHAIEVAWNRNQDSKLRQKFRYLANQQKSRPTNSEFIAVISQEIKANVL